MWCHCSPRTSAIPEIIVIAFDREPVLEVKSVTGHHAARVRWIVGDPVGGGLLLEKTGTLNGQLISDFLSPGLKFQIESKIIASSVNFFILSSLCGPLFSPLLWNSYGGT